MSKEKEREYGIYERKEKNILDYWVKSYFTYNIYYWNYCYKKYLYER